MDGHVLSILYLDGQKRGVKRGQKARRRCAGRCGVPAGVCASLQRLLHLSKLVLASAAAGMSSGLLGETAVC